jgi:hypothetical protein
MQAAGDMPVVKDMLDQLVHKVLPARKALLGFPVVEGMLVQWELKVHKGFQAAEDMQAVLDIQEVQAPHLDMLAAQGQQGLKVK